MLESLLLEKKYLPDSMFSWGLLAGQRAKRTQNQSTYGSEISEEELKEDEIFEEGPCATINHLDPTKFTRDNTELFKKAQISDQ